ncbi:MAG: hypothetical protein KJ941_03255 [Bacteroidetes bacterium]|nr:hypothetical protein [Bacteroidota bacterium]
MKIVNRGYLLVRPTLKFQTWAKNANPDILIDLDDREGSVYLIDDDFFEEEPIIEQLFKKILVQELEAVTGEETLWPDDVSRENFDELFTVEFGSMVFDAEKSDLKKD